MKKGVLWRIVLIALTVVIAAVFFLPNTPLFQGMPEWWKKIMPNKGIVMGLDLQGGLHLVFEVEGEKAVEIATERIASSLSGVFERKKIQAGVKKDGMFVVVTPADAPAALNARKTMQEMYPSMTFSQDKDVLKYKISETERKRIKDTATDQVLEVIRNRIDQFGVAEPIIHRQGENEIVVQLPGVKDPKRAVEIIGKTAQLEFKIVDDESSLAAEMPPSIMPEEEIQLLEKFKNKIPEGDEILFQRVANKETGVVTKRPILLKKETLLSGDLLTEARVSIDERFSEPYVSIKFSSTGAKIFEDITAQNVKKRLAIILDKNVYSAPVIQERIGGGDAQISGGFAMEEAKDLAIVLRAGALPAPVKTLQNVTVGPSLGRDSIEAGKMAGLVGTILVVIFMIFYYRLSGVVADFALVLNILLLLGAMASLNATLTMPGIAGIILAIGMAVDSNVLMFERMREEIRGGKTPKAAVESGYKKAFWTIFDSHVTTLITAAVLFQFGTGPIKGFAVTLSLGVAINLFTALIGTKTVFDIIHSRKEIKRLSI
ncbi:MAG TPA: protein translocase subunit SecD [Nitrospiraceae bacterium]|nr:MAG: protein-export membrane protein SecD [Nitrospirae bacterium GWA2_46_11]OGW23937.1 MAG: protein-export membrane protein SecD [Nitrospirae bacterium GWB2_47_37]HAK89310.1 protein translocase subunit SecD [Nitrospiraceae bacterium]HCZ11630.1 protein translocase subunit SecD [Nitrospiraceae bacterium]